MISEAIKTVISGGNLSKEEANKVMDEIMCGEASPAQIAAFLVGEHMKGETYQEIAGFAESMRAKATTVAIKAKNAIDMCGTGGDGAGTFNISTVASIVVAAAGVPVAKHGNRSVSSKCGSADLFEKFGVNIHLTAQQMCVCIDQAGIGFLFAPILHPATNYAIGPRKDIGVRTVFNMLGPICNPAGVKRQVVGVFNLEAAKLIAEVLKELKSEHVIVVHSEDGLDEVSVYAPSTIFEVTAEKIEEKTISPEDFGLKTYKYAGVVGGTPDENLQIANDVFSGQKGIARDFVVVNAACGLVVGGVASDLTEGAKLAQELLDNGAAQQKIEQLKKVSNSFS